MAWFRFYDEVLDDPKVQQLPGKTFKNWVNILCLAKRNDGVLPPISAVAFALRMTEVETQTLIEILKNNKLLDDTSNGIIPHNWSGRQYKSDVSTDRVKRFRKRSETPEETPPETETETEKKECSSNDIFEKWWKEVPKKVGKGGARRAFNTALKKTSFENLLTKIQEYSAACADKKSEFIAHPDTWLNKERWLDEPAAGGNGADHVEISPEKQLENKAWFVRRLIRTSTGGDSIITSYDLKEMVEKSLITQEQAEAW